MELDSVVIEHPKSTATVYHQGAHLSNWTPQGQEPVVWASQKAIYSPGQPIRGGIPVVFPWFNQGRTPGLSPKHGYVRTANWEYLGCREHSDGSKTATWFFDQQSAADVPGTEHFPHKYALHYRVTLSETLQVELEITNLDEKEFDCELAFHTYLHVGDIETASVHGLEGVEAVDPFLSDQHFTLTEPITKLTGIDRVCFQEPNLEVKDPALERILEIHSNGGTNTIIWNPGPEGAAGMDDMANDEWKKMLCIETGCIYDNAVVLEPGRTYTLSYEITVKPF